MPVKSITSSPSFRVDYSSNTTPKQSPENTPFTARTREQLVPSAHEALQKLPLTSGTQTEKRYTSVQTSPPTTHYSPYRPK